MREKYQITFQTSLLPNGNSHNTASTNLFASVEIAAHINSSNAIEAQAQIDDINNAIQRNQKGLPFDEFWGQVVVSSLWIYPDQNNITVGDDSTTVPISDFLQLLQEWLAFIQQ
jgi:hypothetical protein